MFLPIFYVCVSAVSCQFVYAPTSNSPDICFQVLKKQHEYYEANKDKLYRWEGKCLPIKQAMEV